MTETHRPNPEQIKALAKFAATPGRLLEICKRYAPGGQVRDKDGGAGDWITCNPTREDREPSFSISLQSGAAYDHANGEKVTDPVALVAYLTGQRQGEAASELAGFLGFEFDKTADNTADKTPAKAKPAPASAEPIPDSALKTRRRAHPKHGEPTAEWCYRDSQGQPLMFVQRFDPPGTRKQFNPHYYAGGKWRRSKPGGRLPLYGIHLLASIPDAPVYVCEGEKAADALAELLPGAVAVTSYGGSSTPAKADWSPLTGRKVRIWPDHDQAGAQYARSVAVILGELAASVETLEVLTLNPDAPEKWDAADAAADGFTAEQILAATWIPAGNAHQREDSDEPERGLPIAPNGWRLSSRGVYTDPEESDPEKVTSGAIWIEGRTRDQAGDRYGLALVFIDHDNRTRRLAIPAARLNQDATALAQELADMGLCVIPGKERKLAAYLAAWEPTERILSANRLGWLEDPAGKLAFVMPDKVLGGHDCDQAVIYQPERNTSTSKTVHSAGTLAEWQSTVATPAADHDPLLFALCAGLAPAILAFAPASDSFIVHFTGRTTRGKTTLLQVAASAWGCAADPNDAPSMTFVRRWNMTANALEALCEAHTDLPLVLDELGARGEGDIRANVYQLAGGLGKAALHSDRSIRKERSWRVIAISSGELSIHDRMRDPDGTGLKLKTVKGGLTHRALDIAIDDIVASADAENRQSIVESLKAACARCYGTAGRALINSLASTFTSASAARQTISENIQAIGAKLIPDGTATDTARALRRFALIQVAGELASEAGIISATPERIEKAVAAMASQWLGGGHAQTDEQRIVESVRAFILRHEARFQRINEPADGEQYQAAKDGDTDTDTSKAHQYQDRPVIDRVGFHDCQNNRWCFTPDGLIEAAPGHDKQAIARALKASGFLHTQETGKLQTRIRHQGGRPFVYQVKHTILGEQEEQTEKPAETDPFDPPVPACPRLSPVGGTAPGTEKNQQPQGLSPLSPLSPVKNSSPANQPEKNERDNQGQVNANQTENQQGVNGSKKTASCGACSHWRGDRCSGGGRPAPHPAAFHDCGKFQGGAA